MTTQPTPVEHERISRQELAGLIVALIAGALLRLVANNQPFPSSDHAELAAVVAFFYPRGLDSLGFSTTSVWKLITHAHGTLPPLIGMISSTIVGLLGIPITEFWWNLPFALINLLSVVLAWALARRLGGRWAGIGAALLIAVLPLNAALARASGLSHIPLGSLLQLLTVWCFVRYFQEPTPRRGRIAGLALALDLQVEVFFPLIFILLIGVGIFTVATKKPTFAMRLDQTRRLLFSPKVMLLPLLALLINFGLLIARGTAQIGSGGIMSRMFAGSDRQPGVYVGDFFTNATTVVGWPALLILALGAALMGPALRRMEARAVPLWWSLLYLLPFVLFTRPNVYGYYLLGVLPLAINAAIVAADAGRRAAGRRWVPGLALVLLTAFLGVRALSMIFGVELLPWAGSGTTQGAVSEDAGLKAGAWWVRTHSAPSDAIFADTMFEPYQMSYYVQRPFIAVTDGAGPEAAYLLLATAPRQPVYYLVPPGNQQLLEAHASPAPRLQAIVEVDGAPKLHIYGYGDAPPETIDADTANQRFDEQFGRWRAMFAIGQRQ